MISNAAIIAELEFLTLIDMEPRRKAEMGNFGSKGGLHRIIPADEDHWADRLDLPNYFRRVPLDPGIGTGEPSDQGRPGQELIQPTRTQENEMEEG